MTQTDRALHDRVAAIIERRLGEGGFSVDELAADVDMSRSRLHRRLVRVAGCPPGRMIRRARLLRAARLLAETERPVGEIAAAVGYADPAHFTRSVKRRFGLTPTDFRDRAAGDPARRKSAPPSGA